MSITKEQFSKMLEGIIEDVLKPYIQEQIKREVGDQLHRLFYWELDGEIISRIRKLVSERVEADIRVRVKS